MSDNATDTTQAGWSANLKTFSTANLKTWQLTNGKTGAWHDSKGNLWQEPGKVEQSEATGDE